MLQLSWKPLLFFGLILLFGFCCCLAASPILLPYNVYCQKYNELECKTHGDCDVKNEHCVSDSDEPSSCYVLWSRDEITGEDHIKMKGCIQQHNECYQTECITSAEPSQNNTHYCCCNQTMCNSAQKWEPTTTEATTQVPNEKTPENSDLIYIIIYSTIFNILIISMGVGIFLYRRRNKALFNEIPTNDAEITNSSRYNRPIQLLELKAKGSYGDVWHAKLYNQDVAVKIFCMKEKNSWSKEVEIYNLPGMRHPNILEFFGHEVHTENIEPEFWLISAYQHNGSLCDYLKSHTITYQELCKIAESMTCGLAYLHQKIAHRDFKSKNVLLKNDLSACVADFGLAMIFQSGKPCGETHGQVGTMRYMAPEILEGAISFNRDAFLRIDVYACALVLWEILSRCDATGPVGEYLLPFEAELGNNLFLFELRENVVMKKLRPQILNQWRSHPGISIICETIEECWDYDTDARPTSSCIMERFAELRKCSTTSLHIKNNTNHIVVDVQDANNT